MMIPVGEKNCAVSRVASPMGPAPTIATVHPGSIFPLRTPHRSRLAGCHSTSPVLLHRHLWELGKGWYRHGNPDVLGLRPVDRVAENPAASRAVRVHAAAAVLAFATRGDAGNQNVITRMEGGYAGSDVLDDTNSLMAENAARQAGCNITDRCRKSSF